jgi:hypothetical protein
VSNFHITLPLAGMGGIFLAFMKQVILKEKLEKKGDERIE